MEPTYTLSGFGGSSMEPTKETLICTAALKKLRGYLMCHEEVSKDRW
jgi:hypothetical protein